jgi:hypothetical protein
MKRRSTSIRSAGEGEENLQSNTSLGSLIEIPMVDYNIRENDPSDARVIPTSTLLTPLPPIPIPISSRAERIEATPERPLNLVKKKTGRPSLYGNAPPDCPHNVATDRVCYRCNENRAVKEKKVQRGVKKRSVSKSKSFTYKLAELKTKITKRKPLQVITRVGKDEVLVHSSNLKIKVSHSQRAERHIRAGAMLETLGFDKTTVLDIPLISNQLKQHRKRKYAKAYNQFKRTAKKRVNQHFKDKSEMAVLGMGISLNKARAFVSILGTESWAQAKERESENELAPKSFLPTDWRTSASFGKLVMDTLDKISQDTSKINFTKLGRELVAKHNAENPEDKVSEYHNYAQYLKQLYLETSDSILLWLSINFR